MKFKKVRCFLCKGLIITYFLAFILMTFDKSQRLLFNAFCISIAILPLLLPLFSSHIGYDANNKEAVGYTPALYSWSLHDIFFALSLTTLVACLIYFKQNLRLTINIEIIILTSLGIYALISKSWGHNQYEANKALFMWLCSIGFVYVFIAVLKDKRQLYFFLNAIFVSALVSSLIGIHQYLFNGDWVNQASPPASTFGNKNFAAQYSLIGLIIGLYCLAQSKTVLKKYAYTINCCLILIFIAYAKSRAVWFALTIILVLSLSVIIYKVYQKQLSLQFTKTNIRLLIISASLLVLMLGMNNKGWSVKNFELYQGKATSVYTELSGNSKSTRVPIWLNSIELIKNNWLYGVGIGNWHVAYQLYHQAVLDDTTTNLSTVPRYAHNDFLQLFGELGIGFALLALVLLCFILIRILILITGNKDWQLALMLTAILVGLIAISQFSSPLHRTMPQTIMLLTIAILGFVFNNHTHKIHSNPLLKLKVLNSFELKLKPKWLWLVLIFSIITGVFLVNFHYKLNKANAQYWIATTLAKQKQSFEYIIYYTQQSLKWNPERKRLHNYIGGSLLHLNKPNEAIPWFLSALQSYPVMYPILSNLYKAYKTIGDDKNELAVLTELALIRKLDSRSQYRLAKKLIELGHIEQGKIYLIKAINLNNQNAKAVALYKKHFM